MPHVQNWWDFSHKDAWDSNPASGVDSESWESGSVHTVHAFTAALCRALDQELASPVVPQAASQEWRQWLHMCIDGSWGRGLRVSRWMPSYVSHSTRPVKEKLHQGSQMGREGFIQDCCNRGERLKSTPLKQKAGGIFSTGWTGRKDRRMLGKMVPVIRPSGDQGGQWPMVRRKSIKCSHTEQNTEAVLAPGKWQRKGLNLQLSDSSSWLMILSSAVQVHTNVVIVHKLDCEVSGIWSYGSGRISGVRVFLLLNSLVWYVSLSRKPGTSGLWLVLGRRCWGLGKPCC